MGGSEVAEGGGGWRMAAEGREGLRRVDAGPVYPWAADIGRRRGWIYLSWIVRVAALSPYQGGLPGPQHRNDETQDTEQRGRWKRRSGRRTRRRTGTRVEKQGVGERLPS
ncbi:hypothetical protein KM043_003902 [Ampulex compressa]|nr:hypothetical protein KM043_003902 [Ampulex compressa]